MVSIREIDLCRLTAPPPNYVLNDHNVLQGIGVIDQGVIYLRQCHKRACLVWTGHQFLVWICQPTPLKCNILNIFSHIYQIIQLSQIHFPLMVMLEKYTLWKILKLVSFSALDTTSVQVIIDQISDKSLSQESPLKLQFIANKTAQTTSHHHHHFPKRVPPEDQWHGKNLKWSTVNWVNELSTKRLWSPSALLWEKMWIRKSEWIGNSQKSESKFRCNWMWLWARVIMISTATHTGSDNDLGF